jgi:serine/threonine-protein kinase
MMIQNEVKKTEAPKTELDNYIGKYLNNRYLIRDLIGRGGMGRVYLAEDVAKGGMPIALKILSLNIDSQEVSQRFAREILIGAQLGRKSQHIVKVLGYGFSEERIPFYVMEYLTGQSLKEILKYQHLDISQFIDIVQQICYGLQCAHEGISHKKEVYKVLHRDIKPENIFIVEDAKKGEIVKIFDFGIAKFVTEGGGMKYSDSFIGSLPYCSPEHMEGRMVLDARSDIYSLGILMFEMLTGKHPFASTSNSFGHWYQVHRFQQPPTFEEVNPQLTIPQGIKNLVMSCLAKDIKERPENVNQILEILETIKQNPNSSVYIPGQAHLQLVPVTSVSEKACLQKTWPSNKPVAPIVFPTLLPTAQGNIPTFWSMLPKKEIATFLDKPNSTDFIASRLDLYPMLLWVTALHDAKKPLTRWLSYYLDVEDSIGQKILRSLVDTGYYHLLFFALEEPTQCTEVITLTLTANQRQQLADCLNIAKKSRLTISSDQAKDALKVQYERMKPKILEELVAKHEEKANVKVWVSKAIGKFADFLGSGE